MRVDKWYIRQRSIQFFKSYFWVYLDHILSKYVLRTALSVTDAHCGYWPTFIQMDISDMDPLWYKWTLWILAHFHTKWILRILTHFQCHTRTEVLYFIWGRSYLVLDVNICVCFWFSALFPWSTPRRCAGKRSTEVTEIECESWNISRTTTKLVGHSPFQRVCRRWCG